MRYFFICFCLLIGYASQGQSKVIYFKGDTTTAINKPATPDFKEWQQHIFSRTQLDSAASAKIPDGTYEVIISFIVNRHGEITKVKVVRDPGYGLGKVAAEIIKSYRGKWQPASEDGKAVAAGYKQPIVFLIDTD